MRRIIEERNKGCEHICVSVCETHKLGMLITGKSGVISFILV